VLAYLHEFFADHRSGAVGKFASGTVTFLAPASRDITTIAADQKGDCPPSAGVPAEKGTVPFSAGESLERIDAEQRGKGDSPRILRTDIWLTPFDLGVRQQLDLIIEPSPVAGIYQVRVALKRQSGDDANWHRMNRPFLTELRKQFLQWRTLPPARMLEYVEQSRRL
jgi:hypothetical protein